MKKVVVILFVFIFPLIGYAKDIVLSEQLINEYYSHQSKSKSTQQNQLIIEDKFWLTPLLTRVFINWDNLTAEAQQVFAAFNTEEVVFDGTKEVYTQGNFAFHYTVDSDSTESVDSTDLNLNDVPDYVEMVARILLDEVAPVIHDSLGFSEPPNDNDEIDGAYYDVYISGKEADRYGSGIYGLVNPIDYVYDNPKTLDIIEVWAATSYMVIRNNYEGFDFNDEISLKATLAHEYIHAVQNGQIVMGQPLFAPWIYEMIAVWNESYVYPDIKDNYQYLPGYFSTTDLSLNYEITGNGDVYENHMYGSWIFAQYITEQTHDTILRNVFEYYALYNDPALAIDSALRAEPWNLSLDTIFRQFVIANIVFESDTVFNPFIYKNAQEIRDSLVSNEIELFEEEWELDTVSDIFYKSYIDGNDRLMKLSYDVMHLQSEHNFILDYMPEALHEGEEILLIKVKNGVQDTLKYEFESPEITGSRHTFNIDSAAYWDAFYPVVIRYNSDIPGTSPESFKYNIKIKASDTLVPPTTPPPYIIYPKPSDEFMVIQVDETFLFDPIQIRIVSLSGKVVYNEYINEENIVQTHNLSDGVYIVELYTRKQLIAIDKIMVLH